MADAVSGEPRDEWRDVVVIGSGFAGLASAVEAAEAGARVLVIEKRASTGGNSRISDGGIAVAGTDIQARFGIDDSQELFFSDILRSGENFNRPELVQVLVEKAGEAFTWSRDCLGVEYLDRVDLFGGHSRSRCLTTRRKVGADLIDRLLDRLRQLGVEIRRSTHFTGYIMDGAGGAAGVRVRPVQPRGDSGERQIGVRRGIVLASGGFGADVEFRSRQDPRLDSRIDTTNRATATAEALEATLSIGAGAVDLSRIQLGPWASPDERGFGHGPLFSEYIVFPCGIVIDPESGLRFVNELSNRKELSDAILKRGHPCIGIADSAAVSGAGWNIGPALKKGVVGTFGSLADLACWYGVPAAGLERTVEEFNAGVEAGCDPAFGKPIIEKARPLVRAPYYAMRLWPKVHHVSGGVTIDVSARVLDGDGRPISGLFAAGEVVGGIHGANRLASCAITECLVFGRIAGRAAAESRI